MEIKLPDLPEPTEVEIEVTNRCNAKCVGCPRERLTSKMGMMNQETYTAILNRYVKVRPDFMINKMLGENKYPVITFAGMGEPLLNPYIFNFISQAREKDFTTILFTNASLLDPENVEKLIESAPDYVYISFWGIKKEEYERSMGLKYETALKNIENFIQEIKCTSIDATIIWVDSPHLTSSAEEINEFWNLRGIKVDNENDPWNRGGHITDELLNERYFKHYPKINFDLKIWCSQLYFTDTVCWQGDIIICSCDYYTKSKVLGTVFETTHKEISEKKHFILSSEKDIPLCMNCLKPDRNYLFGSQPWDEILGETEKKKYLYQVIKKDQK